MYTRIACKLSFFGIIIHPILSATKHCNGKRTDALCLRRARQGEVGLSLTTNVIDAFTVHIPRCCRLWGDTLTVTSKAVNVHTYLTPLASGKQVRYACTKSTRLSPFAYSICGAIYTSERREYGFVLFTHIYYIFSFHNLLIFSPFLLKYPLSPHLWACFQSIDEVWI